MVWKQFAFFAQSLDMQPMGVSARDMSLSLGQSESYINKIENKRTLPSMTGFFYICDYLNITPQEELDKLDAPRETIFVFRDRGTGRPTKKERRELDGLMEEIYYDDEE